MKMKNLLISLIIAVQSSFAFAEPEPLVVNTLRNFLFSIAEYQDPSGPEPCVWDGGTHNRVYCTAIYKTKSTTKEEESCHLSMYFVPPLTNTAKEIRVDKRRGGQQRDYFWRNNLDWKVNEGAIKAAVKECIKDSF